MVFERTKARFFLATLAGLGGCGEPETGPVAISAIGAPPQLLNPNLQPLEPPAALLLEAVAQGLVRFDAAGEIEPALAQSWIVSDDGLRYTFRIRRATWADGSRVTAEQVAARLRAAASRASRNPLKPVLGAIESVVAMTDQVLEITLRGPRPNLLQLLAQPEMAVLLDSRGTGPYRLEPEPGPMLRLAMPDDEDGRPSDQPEIRLRGESAARAVARFAEGEGDFVTGGTLADFTLARAAELPRNRLAFDPAQGLFGLAFSAGEGPAADPAIRRALSMAIDRQALVAALGAPGLEPRVALLPGGLEELPRPAAPDWAASPLPMRRELAARAIAALDGERPIRLRVAMPDAPGYRIVFAHLRRDWRLIGVAAERVAPGAPADLRLIDAVAPARLVTWYLRQFTCDSGRVCDPAADAALAAARAAKSPGDRQRELATADQILTSVSPFIPLATPLRWSLVAPRLNGFRANAFARHSVVELIAPRF